MQPEGAGTAAREPARRVAVQRDERAVTRGRNRQAAAVGAHRERCRRRQQRRRRAVGDSLPDAAGRAGGLDQQAGGGVPLQHRDGVARARSDVEVAAAGGDHERRRLCQGASRGAAETAGEADAAGQAGLLRERSGGRIALQHCHRVDVLGGRIDDRAVGRDGECVGAEQRAAVEARAGVVAAAHAGALAAQLEQRAADRIDRERGNGVGLLAGHVQAAAVGGDHQRGGTGEADARGAATVAARPHAAGRAAQLRERSGLGVTREGRHGSRDGRDGVEVPAVGRERDLRNAAQAERMAAARAARGGDASEDAGELRQRARLGVTLEHGDRGAAADVEVVPVGGDRHGPGALEARGAGAAAGRRLGEAELGRGERCERARGARRGVRACERHEGREQRPEQESAYMKLHARALRHSFGESCPADPGRQPVTADFLRLVTPSV